MSKTISVSAKVTVTDDGNFDSVVNVEGEEMSMRAGTPGDCIYHVQLMTEVMLEKHLLPENKL